MRVLIEYLDGVESCALEDFTEKHDLTIVIRERGKDCGQSRFYARFENTDMLEGAFLVGNYGNGATPEEAIAAFVKKIEGKRLVVNAMTDKRREIQVPDHVFFEVSK